MNDSKNAHEERKTFVNNYESKSEKKENKISKEQKSKFHVKNFANESNLEFKFFILTQTAPRTEI